jgi:hypothetical protein
MMTFFFSNGNSHVRVYGDPSSSQSKTMIVLGASEKNHAKSGRTTISPFVPSTCFLLLLVWEGKGDIS